MTTTPIYDDVDNPATISGLLDKVFLGRPGYAASTDSTKIDLGTYVREYIGPSASIITSRCGKEYSVTEVRLMEREEAEPKWGRADSFKGIELNARGRSGADGLLDAATARLLGAFLFEAADLLEADVNERGEGINPITCETEGLGQ